MPWPNWLWLRWSRDHWVLVMLASDELLSGSPGCRSVWTLSTMYFCGFDCCFFYSLRCFALITPLLELMPKFLKGIFCTYEFDWIIWIGVTASSCLASMSPRLSMPPSTLANFVLVIVCWDCCSSLSMLFFLMPSMSRSPLPILCLNPNPCFLSRGESVDLKSSLSWYVESCSFEDHACVCAFGLSLFGL